MHSDKMSAENATKIPHIPIQILQNRIKPKDLGYVGKKPLLGVCSAVNIILVNNLDSIQNQSFVSFNVYS